MPVPPLRRRCLVRLWAFRGRPPWPLGAALTAASCRTPRPSLSAALLCPFVWLSNRFGQWFLLSMSFQPRRSPPGPPPGWGARFGGSNTHESGTDASRANRRVDTRRQAEARRRRCVCCRSPGHVPRTLRSLRSLVGVAAACGTDDRAEYRELGGVPPKPPPIGMRSTAIGGDAEYREWREYTPRKRHASKQPLACRLLTFAGVPANWGRSPKPPRSRPLGRATEPSIAGRA